MTISTCLLKVEEDLLGEKYKIKKVPIIKCQNVLSLKLVFWIDFISLL